MHGYDTEFDTLMMTRPYDSNILRCIPEPPASRYYRSPSMIVEGSRRQMMVEMEATWHRLIERQPPGLVLQRSERITHTSDSVVSTKFN